MNVLAPPPDAVIEPNQSGMSETDIMRIAEQVTRMMQNSGPAATDPGGVSVQSQALQLVHGSEEGGIFRNGPANTAGDALQGGDISAQTIGIVQQARQQTIEIARSGVNVATGFVGYDLKVPAAMLVPFMTPAINMTPREGGVGVDIHNWKAITDFFGGNGPQSVVGAVADGGTPSFVSYNVTPMSNTFQTIGLQNSLTFQSQWRGRQLQGDLRATLTAQLLFALKLVEENWVINMSDRLWTPPPILMSAVNSGGTITSASGANMYFIITAVNAQGETLGTTQQSIAVPGTTSSITLTIFTVPNATKYNVYAGQAGTPPANGAMWLQSATTQFGGANNLNQPASPIQGSFTATMTAPPATSGTAYSTVVTAGNTAKVAVDGGGNIITWKGMQSLTYANAAASTNTGAGGLKSQVIQPAATTGFLALADIQQLFTNMYLNARANPDVLFVSPQDSITINNLVATNGETRVVVQGDRASVATGQMDLTAGFHVTRVLNQVTQRLVNIIQLPFLAQGTMLAGSYQFPYPVPNYGNTPTRIITNQEYYGVDYPPTPATPTSWGMGDYVDSTFVLEFIGGWGAINGIVYH
jgi:hypothetical protein